MKKFTISPDVVAYVKPGTAAGQKLAGVATSVEMTPVDRVTLLFCLMKDADDGVKGAAAEEFSRLPENIILYYIDSAASHPLVLDALARAHHASPWITRALLECHDVPEATREFLREQAFSEPVPPVVEPVAPDGEKEEFFQIGGGTCSSPKMPELSRDDDEDDYGEIDENSEEYLSKCKVATLMGIGEKIKMAMSGDKEWRSILVRDSNKQVSGSVIKNPRITETEIIHILRVGVQNDDIIRQICANRDWVKNYKIRKALVDCPRTPLPNALRYLSSLNEKDIAGYAKSRNISSVISTQAKRLLLAKKR